MMTLQLMNVFIAVYFFASYSLQFMSNSMVMDTDRFYAILNDFFFGGGGGYFLGAIYLEKVEVPSRNIVINLTRRRYILKENHTGSAVFKIIL